jgi:phosphatidylglycerophosphatase A
MNFLLLKWVRRIGASVMFIGYVPLISGTVGSALMVALIWYANTRWPLFFNPSHALPFWLTCIGISAASIWLSNDSETTFGRGDPPQIIIDECAGQLITFLMVPLSWRTLVLGFALFRFFDVVKPFSVHRLEELEGGAGITMDDVAAGVLSNVCLHATLWIYHALSSWL